MAVTALQVLGGLVWLGGCNDTPVPPPPPPPAPVGVDLLARSGDGVPIVLTHEGGRRYEQRPALELHPPASWKVPLDVVAPGRLLLGLGVRHRPDVEVSVADSTVLVQAPQALETDGVRFEVVFQAADGDPELLLRRHLDPNQADDRGWIDLELDLSTLDGQSGTLEIRTEGSADPAGEQDTANDVAYVSGPRFVPAAATPGERPNILLIGVDTLRADHLGCYGYARPTSPHLDALAASGLAFDRAIAPAPWTLPAFSSILTSLYPSRHGAGWGGRGGYSRLHPDAVLLSEMLGDAGYETVARVNNIFLTPSYGLDQGFEAFNFPNFSFFPDPLHAFEMGEFKSGPRDAEALGAFFAADHSRPWFVFWHLMDTHLPYVQRPALGGHFVDPDYAGLFAEVVGFDALVKRPGRRRYAHEGAPPLPDMTEADAQQIVDLYDAEIRALDAAVGAALEALERAGQADNTVVVFTADHGEGLADHGHYHHGYTLFDDQIHVPLLARFPGRSAGERIPTPVSTVDIAPMLLAAAGLDTPEGMQGINRLERREGPVFSESATYDSSALKAVVLGDMKYLHDPVFGTEAVYRLDEDPGERHDALAEEADAAAEARTLLDAFRRANLAAGRYHLRVTAAAGTPVEGRLVAGEVFDANAWISGADDGSPAFDLDRKTLSFATEAGDDGVELSFWFRGDTLTATVKVGDREHRIERARDDIAGAPVAEGGLALWLDDRGHQPVNVESSAEQTEQLEALGYVR